MLTIRVRLTIMFLSKSASEPIDDRKTCKLLRLINYVSREAEEIAF
jgi:hypothetical protein